MQIFPGHHLDQHHVSRQQHNTSGSLQVPPGFGGLPGQATRLPDRGGPRIPVQLRLLAADGECDKICRGSWIPDHCPSWHSCRAPGAPTHAAATHSFPLLQKLKCQRKEPCRLFSVKKAPHRPEVDEVTTSTLCSCPHSHRCPGHHLDVGVVPGRVYSEDAVRAYTGYCM